MKLQFVSPNVKGRRSIDDGNCDSEYVSTLTAQSRSGLKAHSNSIAAAELCRKQKRRRDLETWPLPPSVDLIKAGVQRSLLTVRMTISVPGSRTRSLSPST